MNGPTRQRYQLGTGQNPDVRRDGPQPKPSVYRTGGQVRPSRYAEGGKVDMMDRPSRVGKDTMSDRDVREGHFPRSRGFKHGGKCNY